MPEREAGSRQPVPTLSLVVNTRNEAGRLERLVASAAGVDEVVVGDMASDDGTPELAERLGAVVLPLPNAGYCEPGRMPAIGAATSDWVLLLDADEHLPKGAVEAIRDLLVETPAPVVAYRLPRVNFLGPRPIRGTGWGLPEELQARLFRPTAVEWPTEIHGRPRFDGVVLDLSGDGPIRIDHDNFDDLTSMFEKLNRYTSVEARQILDAGGQPSLPLGLRFALEEVVNRYDPEADGTLSLVLSLAMFAYRFNIQAKAAEGAGWPDDVVIARESLVRAINRFWSELRVQELGRTLAAVEADSAGAGGLMAEANRIWQDMPPTLSDLTIYGSGESTEGAWAELFADERGRRSHLVEELVKARAARNELVRGAAEAEAQLQQAVERADRTAEVIEELIPAANATAARLREVELALSTAQDRIAELERELTATRQHPPAPPQPLVRSLASRFVRRLRERRPPASALDQP